MKSMHQHCMQPLILWVAVMSSACASSGMGPSVDGIVELAEPSAVPASLVNCPSSPNCVSSFSAEPSRQVDAFELGARERSAFQAEIVLAIKADGGVVKDEREGYLWATYTSSVFRFVDDIEWLFNADKNAFDVRSASRVGHSDFGVNAKRVARLRSALAR